MTPDAVKKLGVVGAGQMGQGIAQIAAQAGVDVIVVDAAVDFAKAGVGKIKKQLDRLVEKGKLEASARDATMAHLKAADAHKDLADCDVVIEAAPEREELKLAIAKSLGDILRDDAIFASNTSSISITKIAAASGRPDRVIGMHFMNPVPLMKLVEIVRGLPTSDSTYDTTVALARKFGKITIGARDIPGFIVNRMLIPLLNEACYGLYEGLGTAADIDTGVKLGLNHPMGPLELADLIGLDTCLAIAEVLHRELGDDKYRPCPLLRQYVAAGWLGKKVGRGFYEYDSGGGKKGDPVSEAYDDFETLKVSVDGPIAIVTISREAALNALSAQVLAELTHVAGELEISTDVRVVILTGAGDKAFVAGADISEMHDLTPIQGHAFAQMGGAVGDAIEGSDKPWIAAVNGFALGGGCELAMACDFIYASEKAKFGQPEVKLGVIPGFGGTQRLARRVGVAKAKELCMTGDVIDAAEALRIGLADKVVAHGDLVQTCKDVAGRIAANAPLAVSAVKHLVHDGQSTTLDHALALEQQAFGLLFSTADQREGMAAFLAKPKRAAKFEGK